MAATAARVRSETIIFQGIAFRRYPDLPRSSDRVYFRPDGGLIKQGVESLHPRGHSVLEGATAPTDTQADFADAVNLCAFFLTNSCTLSGPCPVSVSTSSDIRS